jgi:hypothetical protein
MGVRRLFSGEERGELGWSKTFYLVYTKKETIFPQKSLKILFLACQGSHLPSSADALNLFCPKKVENNCTAVQVLCFFFEIFKEISALVYLSSP